MKLKKYLPSILIGLGVLLVLGFVVWAATSANNDNKPATPVAITDATKQELASGHSIGPDNSKVVLTEFGDFQCPACGRTEPIVESLRAQFDGKFKLVFKQFPLTQIHQNAEMAALAAEAADAQGKFWPYHDLLYAKQTEWADVDNPLDKFVSYAASLGLDTNRFRQDVEGKTYIGVIQASQSLGDKLKVAGTPTFYLNGVVLDLNTEQDLQTKLQEAINQAGS